VGGRRITSDDFELLDIIDRLLPDSSSFRSSSSVEATPRNHVPVGVTTA
jgi:hypothetical protein